MVEPTQEQQQEPTATESAPPALPINYISQQVIASVEEQAGDKGYNSSRPETLPLFTVFAQSAILEVDPYDGSSHIEVEYRRRERLIEKQQAPDEPVTDEEHEQMPREEQEEAIEEAIESVTPEVIGDKYDLFTDEGLEKLKEENLNAYRAYIESLQDYDEQYRVLLETRMEREGLTDGEKEEVRKALGDPIELTTESRTEDVIAAAEKVRKRTLITEEGAILFVLPKDVESLVVDNPEERGGDPVVIGALKRSGGIAEPVRFVSDVTELDDFWSVRGNFEAYHIADTKVGNGIFWEVLDSVQDVRAGKSGNFDLIKERAKAHQNDSAGRGGNGLEGRYELNVWEMNRNGDGDLPAPETREDTNTGRHSWWWGIGERPHLHMSNLLTKGKGMRLEEMVQVKEGYRSVMAERLDLMVDVLDRIQNQMSPQIGQMGDIPEKITLGATAQDIQQQADTLRDTFVVTDKGYIGILNEEGKIAAVLIERPDGKAQFVADPSKLEVKSYRTIEDNNFGDNIMRLVGEGLEDWQDPRHWSERKYLWNSELKKAFESGQGLSEQPVEVTEASYGDALAGEEGVQLAQPSKE